MRFAGCLITVLLGMALISPKAMADPFGSLRLKYSRALYPLGLVPIYPLIEQEGLKPGDIVSLRHGRGAYLVRGGIGPYRMIAPLARAFQLDDMLVERTLQGQALTKSRLTELVNNLEKLKNQDQISSNEITLFNAQKAGTVLTPEDQKKQNQLKENKEKAESEVLVASKAKEFQEEYPALDKLAKVAEAEYKQYITGINRSSDVEERLSKIAVALRNKAEQKTLLGISQQLEKSGGSINILASQRLRQLINESDISFSKSVETEPDFNAGEVTGLAKNKDRVLQQWKLDISKAAFSTKEPANSPVLLANLKDTINLIETSYQPELKVKKENLLLKNAVQYPGFTLNRLTKVEAKSLVPNQANIPIVLEGNYSRERNNAVAFKDMEVLEIGYSDFKTSLLKTFHAPDTTIAEWKPGSANKNILKKLNIPLDSALAKALDADHFGDSHIRLKKYAYLVIPYRVVYAKQADVVLSDNRNNQTAISLPNLLIPQAPAEDGKPKNDIARFALTNNLNEGVNLQATFEKPMAVGMLPVYLKFKRDDNGYHCVDMYAKM